MKVNGIAFKKAREEIRKNASFNKNKLQGEASEGTQEWLASKAKIISKSGELTSLSVRTIQYLEKGEASIQVVDAVSPYLGINGRELIFDYGKDSVKLSAIGSMDFRVAIFPKENLSTYQHSALLISVDPLFINFKSDDIDSITLEKITIVLTIDDLKIDFKWLYEVSLTPNGNGWLGIVGEVFPVEMTSPEKYRSPLMFQQISSSKLLWGDFIKKIEGCSTTLIKVELVADFGTFLKPLNIGVSVSQIRHMVSESNKRNGTIYPYYLQPDALTWQ